MPAPWFVDRLGQLGTSDCAGQAKDRTSAGAYPSTPAPTLHLYPVRPSIPHSCPIPMRHQ
jgi:hypothetical protein